MLSKIVSTIEDSANTASMNFNWVEKNAQNVFHYRSHVKLLLKPGTASWMGPAENFPISSPVRLIIQKLFWALEEGFKIPLCVASRTRYLHGIQIWRVIRWPFFIFNHVQTALTEALLRDTCNAWRHMHLVESAAPFGISRLYSSMNFGSIN